MWPSVDFLLITTHLIFPRSYWMPPESVIRVQLFKERPPIKNTQDWKKMAAKSNPEETSSLEVQYIYYDSKLLLKSGSSVYISGVLA